MQAKKSLNLWRDLYEVTGNLKQLAPWEYLWDMDTIIILLQKPKTITLCSIMGRNGECYGISSYIGSDAMQGFDMLAKNDAGLTTEFVMMEQTCLTVYWGDREEVPPQQKKIIKELGLKFRGRGNWPYFISYKRKYTPWPIDMDEVDFLLKIYKNLFMALRAYIEKKLSVDFINGEHLIRQYDKKTKLWLNYAAPFDIEPRKYPSLVLTDELLKQRLAKRKKIRADFSIDISYLDTPIKDQNCPRPINPRIFVVMDHKTGEVITAQLLEYEDEEAKIVLTFLLSFIEQYGWPKSIRARNPWIIGGIHAFCEEFQIKLIEDPLHAIDEFLDGMCASF